MYEIRQNGQCVLQSKDEHSIPMFFNNLTGVNIKGFDYKMYIRHVAREQMGFIPGQISLFKDGVEIRTGTIPDY